jgi:hypothetical protein
MPTAGYFFQNLQGKKEAAKEKQEEKKKKHCKTDWL